MIQLELFNRVNPDTNENHIDDTYIVIGPFNSFQWTYGHLRLQSDNGETDLIRRGTEAIVYKDMFFGDFRITNYTKKFKENQKVNVDECYRNDECTEHFAATETATVLSEPKDNEELVMIKYENGGIDFVPQDILTII